MRPPQWAVVWHRLWGCWVISHVSGRGCAAADRACPRLHAGVQQRSILTNFNLCCREHRTPQIKRIQPPLLRMETMFQAPGQTAPPDNLPNSPGQAPRMPISQTPCVGVPLEGGVLPLSQSSVTRALSQRTLTTLLPGAVQMTFCAASDPSGKPGPGCRVLCATARCKPCSLSVEPVAQWQLHCHKH